MLAARKAGKFASPLKGSCRRLYCILVDANVRPEATCAERNRQGDHAAARIYGSAHPILGSSQALHQKSSDDHAFGITLDVEAAPPTTDGIAAIGPHDEASVINPFAISVLMNANSGQPV